MTFSQNEPLNRVGIEHEKFGNETEKQSSHFTLQEKAFTPHLLNDGGDDGDDESSKYSNVELIVPPAEEMINFSKETQTEQGTNSTTVSSLINNNNQKVKIKIDNDNNNDKSYEWFYSHVKEQQIMQDSASNIPFTTKSGKSLDEIMGTIDEKVSVDDSRWKRSNSKSNTDHHHLHLHLHHPSLATTKEAVDGGDSNRFNEKRNDKDKDNDDDYNYKANDNDNELSKGKKAMKSNNLNTDHLQGSPKPTKVSDSLKLPQYNLEWKDEEGGTWMSNPKFRWVLLFAIVIIVLVVMLLFFLWPRKVSVSLITIEKNGTLNTEDSNFYTVNGMMAVKATGNMIFHVENPNYTPMKFRNVQIIANWILQDESKMKFSNTTVNNVKVSQLHKGNATVPYELEFIGNPASNKLYLDYYQRCIETHDKNKEDSIELEFDITVLLSYLGTKQTATFVHRQGFPCKLTPQEIAEVFRAAHLDIADLPKKTKEILQNARS